MTLAPPREGEIERKGEREKEGEREREGKGRGVYPYLPMATNAPWSILGENEKSILGGMKKFNIKSVNFVHKFNN